MVPPTDVDQNQADIMKLGQTSDVSIFTFNHTMQFTIPITEEFMEYCAEGALSIEVYGHRSAGFASKAKWAERIRLAKSLADRWAELTRKLEFHVEVQELSESGEYAPVEVQPRSTVG